MRFLLAKCDTMPHLFNRAGLHARGLKSLLWILRFRVSKRRAHWPLVMPSVGFNMWQIFARGVIQFEGDFKGLLVPHFAFEGDVFLAAGSGYSGLGHVTRWDGRKAM